MSLASTFRNRGGDDEPIALDDRLRDALPSTEVHPLRRNPDRGRRRALLQPLAWVGRPADDNDMEALRRASRFVEGSEPFGTGVFAIRWGAAAVSFVLAVDEIVDGRPGAMAWAAILILLTVVRSRWPIRFDGSIRTAIDVGIEAVVPLAAAMFTGFWGSPLVPALAVPVAVAGFGAGLLPAVRTAVTSSAILTAASLFAEPGRHSGQLSLEWSAVLVLLAVVAGHSRPSRARSGSSTARRWIASSG